MTEGRIVTFYSFKGGVGRTMLLANVAWLAARWGKRVLVQDWDLEAPGLHHYLSPPKARPESPGVLDLLQGKDLGPGAWRSAVQRVAVEGASGLDVMHSGRDGRDYRSGVQGFDWKERIPEGLGEALETWRSEWLATYDLVLIDCRTGWSEIAAVGAAQLPDVLVTVLNPNQQGFEGTRQLVDSVHRARSDAWYERSRVRVVPILTRLDRTVEHARATEWWERFVKEFGPDVDRWREPAVSTEAVLDRLRVPYVPYWSYGEDVAAKAGWGPTTDIGQAAAHLAALLLAGLEGTEDLVLRPLELLSRVNGAPPRAFRYDVHIVHARADRLHAEALKLALRELGAKVSTSDDAVDDRALERWFDHARDVVFLRGRGAEPPPGFLADVEIANSLTSDRRPWDVVLGDEAGIGPLDNLVSAQAERPLRGPVSEVARQIWALPGGAEPDLASAPGYVEHAEMLSRSLARMNPRVEALAAWMRSIAPPLNELAAGAEQARGSREAAKRWLERAGHLLDRQYEAGRGVCASFLLDADDVASALKRMSDPEYGSLISGTDRESLGGLQEALLNARSSLSRLRAGTLAIPPATARIRRARGRLAALHAEITAALERLIGAIDTILGPSTAET